MDRCAVMIDQAVAVDLGIIAIGGEGADDDYFLTAVIAGQLSTRESRTVA